MNNMSTAEEDYSKLSKKQLREKIGELEFGEPGYFTMFRNYSEKCISELSKVTRTDMNFLLEEIDYYHKVASQKRNW